MAPSSRKTRAAARGTKQASPPVSELGAITQGWGGAGAGSAAFGPSVPFWTQIVYDDLETVPELQFPQSIRTYNAMRNDSQIDGLYAGCTFPIRRYKWMLHPNGCEPGRVEKLAADLNLPIKGDDPDRPRGRTKNRFVFDNHLQDALKSILFGFYGFEQVGWYDAEGDGLWHLRKLAPRPPNTIQDILINETGGLVMVRQNISGGKELGRLAEVPVDRLVWYTWDKDGANWQGRSMLRSIYRNWLIKDRLMRVDAVKHERNGMGMPMAYGAQGMTDTELKKLALLAQSFKAGESSGGAMPHGTELRLEGVRGHIPDTIASLNFHNEEMARRFLMMFLQLGSTLHGSRALGKDFVDYFQLAQEMLANWFLEVFNEHVIEDYWDWNYGESEEHTPLVVYQRNDDPRMAAADLAVLIQNGAIQVDDQIEQAVRESMDLPSRNDDSERTFIPGHVPVTAAPQGPGDQPGQPSTQPGNADPQFPDQNPTTARRPSGGPVATLSSPAQRPDLQIDGEVTFDGV